MVTKAEKREELSKGMLAKFLSKAPVVIVACADKKAWPDWCYIDVTIAVDNMVLAPTGEDWERVGLIVSTQVKSLPKIPSTYAIVVLLAMGYAREKLDVARRFMQLAPRSKET